MGHYKSHLRDIEFNLFEMLVDQEVLGSEPYPDVDEQTARGILDEVNRLATGPIAQSFADADRNPPVFDPAAHSVTMPESFKKSFAAFMDAEYFRLELPAELGGTVAPRSLHWAIAELILGANPAIWMYSSGASMAHALWRLGTPEQKEFARLAIDRKWTSTMALTEPDAGSGRGRRWAHQGHCAERRHVAHRGRQAVHPPAPSMTWQREHLPPGARPPRGEPVPAPRACPCSSCPSTWSARTGNSASSSDVCHRGRAQDGPGHVHHLRARSPRR